MAESLLHFNQRPLIVVMGVSGSGKTSVGQALADKLGLPYLEADDFHPPENVAKMSNAIALTDEDRWPWLEALTLGLVEKAQANDGAITSCSALKRSYRDFIRKYAKRPVLFVFLDGDKETISKRMQKRTDHYMPISLLDSQLSDLERPQSDETSMSFSIEKSIEELANEIATNVAVLKTKRSF